jgi:hypothetical protein
MPAKNREVRMLPLNRREIIAGTAASGLAPAAASASSPCCGSRPRQTATELRVTDLSYEVWSADLPDINAANCLILCGQVGSAKAHIVDVSDVFSGVGGRKFSGRVDSW